jgi:Uncharacterized protein conserved in bacteria (DUF2252)
MNIVQATRAYESWLQQHIPIVAADVRRKHKKLRKSPFVFLRGTFYRWLQRWPDVCAKLVDAPRVNAVGDLHVENFGTWRDAEGRLVWGVNDFDEACVLPYTHDLVRLATSALLAIDVREFGLSRRDACAAILDGYRTSFERGGRPVVLAERRRRLRQIAVSDLRDPVRFWKELHESTPAKAGVPHRTLRTALPDPNLKYRVVHRVAGIGSLGRPRFVALAEWCGSLIAREAKARAPSAAVWARTVRRGAADSPSSAQILDSAVRVPDPFFTIEKAWIVRRLAPDCSRIELTDVPKRRDEARFLRTMGWETANVHLGTRNERVTRDVGGRSGRWLERAARDMADAVERDWQQWVDNVPA